jgi:RNA recognition motif-containing protein
MTYALSLFAEGPFQSFSKPSQNKILITFFLPGSCQHSTSHITHQYNCRIKYLIGTSQRLDCPIVINMDYQPQTSEQTTPSKRIYIGNLPYVAQAQDVEQYLEEAGFQIERLDMSTDPFTGRNPSYCFAELFSAEEAERAINLLPGASFMGRPLRVNVHTPKTRGGAVNGNGNGGMTTPLRTCTRSPFSTQRTWRANGQSPATTTTTGTNGTPSKPTQDRENSSPYAFNRWERNDAATHFTAPVETGRRLYVGGLPQINSQELVNEEMKAMFAAYTVEAVSKLISPHESAASLPGDHHYCFVDFATTEEAVAAAEALNGVTMSTGGKLKVNMARDRPNRKVVREQNLAVEKPAPVRDFGSSWRRAN